MLSSGKGGGAGSPARTAAHAPGSSDAREREASPLARAELERVAVVGCSSSGKTTLARRLAELLDAPHVEQDALFWREGWQPRPTDEFHARSEAALARERWVIDGNYESVREAFWSRATSVIWLDYRFPLVFRRAVTRTLRRLLTGEEAFSGNRESLRRTFFSRDSILIWVVTSYRWRRREIGKLVASGRFPHTRFHRLRGPRDADRLLERVAASVAEPDAPPP